MMENLSFEESLEKLEEIVNKLENGDVPLDDAIDEFKNSNGTC
jgi:Exonuclease VII small subunit.